MMDFLRRKPKNLDGDDAGAGDGTGDLLRNQDAARKQKLLLYGGGGAAALAAMFWIMAPTEHERKSLDQLAKDDTTKVSTDDMLNRNLADKEWMQLSEGQIQSQANQIKGLQGQGDMLRQLQEQVQQLQGEKSAMTEDGTRVLTAYQQENDQLKAALQSAKAAPAPAPSSFYGNGAQGFQPRPAGPGAPGGFGAAGAGASAAAPRSNEIKLVSFGGEAGGTADRIEKGKTTVYTDSPNYLPPNSIARAKVVVGVDATTAVKSQSDPLPVVLRITGPARSVYADGRLLRTNIQGCMVNGAAQGDLSSEKVYVKLARMTCPQPGGRYAVSDVKGFIAFGGKTGVRGRVVSRESGLVSQAFIAGLAGGFGRGFSANTQSLLNGTQVTVNGKREQLGLGDIAQAGLGEGVATSADQVSKYLIERAEQYQPVIEMPTGIDVEIVFLDGVFIRN